MFLNNTHPIQHRHKATNQTQRHQQQRPSHHKGTIQPQPQIHPHTRQGTNTTFQQKTSLSSQPLPKRKGHPRPSNNTLYRRTIQTTIRHPLCQPYTSRHNQGHKNNKTKNLLQPIQHRTQRSPRPPSTTYLPSHSKTTLSLQPHHDTKQGTRNRPHTKTTNPQQRHTQPMYHKQQRPKLSKQYKGPHRPSQGLYHTRTTSHRLTLTKNTILSTRKRTTTHTRRQSHSHIPPTTTFRL